MTMNPGFSLGAIAKLVISDPQKLEDSIIHRIPNRMLVERLKADSRQATIDQDGTQ
jgi:hypothetical protein